MEINLAHNSIEKLEENFFSSFTKLDRIGLEHNPVTLELNRDSFQGYTKLIELKLLGSKSVVIETGCWRNLKTLTILSLESPGLDIAQRLSSLEQLGKLSIHNSDQSTIETAFSGDKTPFENLYHLEISNCSLATLDHISLSASCPDLSKLHLSDNRFQTIKSSWFTGLNNLKVLNFANNLIETLDNPSVFADRPALTGMILGGNKLATIHRRLFRGLTSLKHLDLSQNSLVDLDDGLFRDLVRLEQVELGRNNFKQLNITRLFAKTRNIVLIDLSENQLDNNSFNEASIECLDFQYTLTELNLSKNKLRSIGFLRNMAALEKLNLSENEIETLCDLTGNLLGRLVKLTNIDLSSNHLTKLQLSTFDHLSYLTHLDLSNNLFESEERDDLKSHVSSNLVSLVLNV